MADGRTRRREDTRQRLYDAAIELIAERGYSATTVDDIAERAGVAKGTVYYNFPSKTALVEGLLTHGIGMLSAEFRTAAAGQDPPGAVAALVRAELSYVDRHRAFAQLLLSELWRTDREWRQTLHAVRDDAVNVIAGVLRAGVASGDFDSALDVPLASSALFGVSLVVAVDWLVFQPDRRIDDVHEALMKIVRARVTV